MIQENKIGQDEVLRFIEANNKPVSARQISEAIDEGFGLVCKNAKKLAKRCEIKCIEVNRYIARTYLKNDKISRRMHLYFALQFDFSEAELVDLHSI